MTYFHADRFDDALSAFECTLVLAPNCALAWNGIGRVNYKIGTSDVALATYECAINIDIDPHYEDAYYGIGILLSAKLGKYEDTIVVFQYGLAANLGESFLENCIGSTYARMGRFDKAIATLEQSLARNSADTFALSWLSLLYLQQKRFEEAIGLCQREIALEPAHSAHYLHSRLDQAILQLQQAVALEPKDYEARVRSRARIAIPGARLRPMCTHRPRRSLRRRRICSGVLRVDERQYRDSFGAARSGSSKTTVATRLGAH